MSSTNENNNKENSGGNVDEDFFININKNKIGSIDLNLTTWFKK